VRHPEAEQRAAECDAYLPRVFERIGLAADTDYERIGDGWVNLCYATDEVVVRFNARDPQLPKFRREAHVYRALAGGDLPVPEVLWHAEDPDGLDYPILVCQRLPGRNLEADWPDLAGDQRRELARKAGRLLARLHEVEVEEFGDLFGPRFDDWSDYLKLRYVRFIGQCQDLDIFSDREEARFERAVNSAIDALPTVDSPRLVHNDYHLGNLLYQDGELTGLIDFEWAFCGDPTWDLTGWPTMDDSWPDSAEPFRRGYTEAADWPDPCDLPRHLYQCIQNLELCAVCERFLSAKEAAEDRQATLAQLEELERRLP
jgi:aminoglycoside phosphotransferase (APT) family kinase protein